MAANGNGYLIREARKDDESAVVNLLEEHFFPHKYLNRVYYEKNKHKIDDIERENIALDVNTIYTLTVANHPSLIAVHKDSKEIVGISLMVLEENKKFAKVMNSEERNSTPKSTTKKQRRSKLVAEFSTYILRPIINSFDIFAQFPSHQRALDLLTLCVNPDNSGHGLATSLIKESIKYAKNNGCGFIYGLFTSPSSQKAAEKNGLKILNNVDMWSICDSDGIKIYQDEEYHIISTMGKEIYCQSLRYKQRKLRYKNHIIE